jgi:uncharacterized membrane protein (UPF0136 family)
MDSVGTASAIMVILALLIGLVAGYLTRRWLVAFLLGTLASQVYFYAELEPSNAAEMLLPLAYSAAPALIGALVGCMVRKRRGLS